MAEKDRIVAIELSDELKSVAVQDAVDCASVNDAEICADTADAGTDSASNGADNGSKKDAKKKNLGVRDIVKCVIVLAAIAVVAGVLLGLINWLTYVDPDAAIRQSVAKYFAISADGVTSDDARCVSDGGKNFVKNCYIATDGDGNVLGYCYYSVGSGAKDGTLELLVYISADGVINEITVYSQGETAGYFDRVEKANKSKYIGIDIDETPVLTLIKDEGKQDIDNGIIAGVSQATYTSRGYHNAIAAAAYAYANYEEV